MTSRFSGWFRLQCLWCPGHEHFSIESRLGCRIKRMIQKDMPSGRLPRASKQILRGSTNVSSYLTGFCRPESDTEGSFSTKLETQILQTSPVPRHQNPPIRRADPSRKARNLLYIGCECFQDLVPT